MVTGKNGHLMKNANVKKIYLEKHQLVSENLLLSLFLVLNFSEKSANKHMLRSPH